jgi:hypothetical protein
MVAAATAAVAAIVGGYYSFMAHAKTERAVVSGLKPAYQALCVSYSDFVLTQAHNGYTPEQIQEVIDFASSHTVNPERPDRFNMPNRWPSISDEKTCGTPAEIIAHAKP